ncbi:diversity-generating retroelement protein bAvd family protein [Photobacterium lutimaris]|uniref:Diversity-generating retroelement protein bAvd family protein n=2 Tax=Photobacterium lutimaris TaxID=388278 RepID=A0A2T3IXC3_9GAMM|nr:four helix bundle protein [Photobacterium lutimaris]PSU33188.1 diversity-generating retroelement protein bAvd family protein [Photobacterium lutimaris]TDR75233.1 four helix bundle protein [Photobacterium lutimaris]
MNYKKLKVWKDSYQQALDVYKAIDSCKDYSLKDQIRRSCISVPSNIAEGDERFSDKEAVRFFFIAKGSNGELVTQLMLARDLSYLRPSTANSLIQRAGHISAQLGALIRHRQKTYS